MCGISSHFDCFGKITTPCSQGYTVETPLSITSQTSPAPSYISYISESHHPGSPPSYAKYRSESTSEPSTVPQTPVGAKTPTPETPGFAINRDSDSVRFTTNININVGKRRTPKRASDANASSQTPTGNAAGITGVTVETSSRNTTAPSSRRTTGIEETAAAAGASNAFNQMQVNCQLTLTKQSFYEKSLVSPGNSPSSHRKKTVNH